MRKELRKLERRVIRFFKGLSWISDFYCPTIAMNHQKVLARGYSSQYGQDLFLEGFLHFLPKKHKYIFIDIGAYDGLTLSNSFFLDSNDMWEGVCIEANPRVFTKLVHNRIKPKALNFAISDSDGEADFISNSGYSEMLSGLKAEFSSKHSKRIQFDNNHFGGDSKLISVPKKHFGNLLEQLEIQEVDLLMVDVEGGEYAIISSIDFDKVSISVILVERNYSSRKILPLLLEKKFRRVIQLGSDDLYVNENLL
jgi:FkbM family methyltransferase